MELTFDLKDIFTKSKDIITHPKDFFERNEKEIHSKEIKHAVVFSIVMSITASLITIVSIFLLSLNQDLFQTLFVGVRAPTAIELVPIFFVSTIAAVLMTFVWGYLLSYFLKLTKVDINFQRAFKIYAYSRAPLSLLGWIPIAGIFFSLVYANYVLALGVSKTAKISLKKSAIRIVAFILIMVLSQTLIGFLLGSLM